MIHSFISKFNSVAHYFYFLVYPMEIIIHLFFSLSHGNHYMILSLENHWRNTSMEILQFSHSILLHFIFLRLYRFEIIQEIPLSRSSCLHQHFDSNFFTYFDGLLIDFCHQHFDPIYYYLVYILFAGYRDYQGSFQVIKVYSFFHEVIAFIYPMLSTLK